MEEMGDERRAVALRALLLLILFLFLGWLNLTTTLTGTISRLCGACSHFSFGLLDLRV